MKLIVVVGVLCVVPPLTSVGGEDVLAVPSEMVEKVLLEMPLKSMDYYSERFYPDMIKSINKMFYNRKSRSSAYPEKRIRNIKLDMFLNIPNDRQGEFKSSFAFLSNETTSSFAIYSVKGGKGKQIIDIHSPDVPCIFGMSQERTAVKAKACREDVPNMMWDLIPNKYGDFWIRQRGTQLCLVPVLSLGTEGPLLVQLLRCDRWNSHMIWEIHDAYLYYKKVIGSRSRKTIILDGHTLKWSSSASGKGTALE